MREDPECPPDGRSEAVARATLPGRLEEILLDSERTIALAEVAACLRTVADKLEGGDSVTLNPPASVEFELEGREWRRRAEDFLTAVPSL